MPYTVSSSWGVSQVVWVWKGARGVEGGACGGRAAERGAHVCGALPA
mgnify:CR=1 FL=1